MNKTLGLPPHQLQLRVYEPLAAFPANERRAWTDYVAARPPSREELAASLYTETVQANAVANGPRLPRQSQRAAYVVEHGNSVLICPVHLRFLAVRAAEARPDLFAPTGLARGAGPALLASLHDGLRAGTVAPHHSSDRRIRIRTAVWAVPIAWFGVFAPGDRALAETDRLVLRCAVHDAVARLAEASDALKRLMGGMGPTFEIAELAEWLTQFHPRGLVELDYGNTVSSLIANGILLRDEDGRAFDESPDDLAAGLEALSFGDLTGAAASYRRLNERWARARLLASAS